MLRSSNVRLKVRNIDEKQVTNDDLRVSIKYFILFLLYNDYKHILGRLTNILVIKNSFLKLYDIYISIFSYWLLNLIYYSYRNFLKKLVSLLSANLIEMISAYSLDQQLSSTRDQSMLSKQLKSTTKVSLMKRS